MYIDSKEAAVSVYMYMQFTIQLDLNRLPTGFSEVITVLCSLVNLKSKLISELYVATNDKVTC